MKEERNKAPRNKTAGWRRFVYVEPAVFLYLASRIVMYNVMTQYVFTRMAKQHGLPVGFLRSDKGGCGAILDKGNNTFRDIEKKVQAGSALLNLGDGMFVRIPCLFSSLLFGAWSDKNGRRPALISPTVGVIIHSVILLVVVYYDLSIYIIFIGSFIDGCSGYIPTMSQTAKAYIADVSSRSRRVFRMAVYHSMSLLAFVVGFLLSGVWIQRYGFAEPLWFILGCQAAALLYFILLLPESRTKSEDAQHLFSLAGLRKTWVVLRRCREAPGRKGVIVLISCSSFLGMALFGTDGAETLFLLGTPLCFSSAMIGYLLSYFSMVFAVGGPTLTSKFVLRRLNEFKVLVLGLMCTALSFIWLAFSDRRWMIYVYPLFAFPGGAIAPIVTGWLSKIVEKDEQGAIFAVTQTLNALAIIIGVFIFNPTYAALVNVDFKGGVFLVVAGILLIPFVAVCCLRRQFVLVEQAQTDDIDQDVVNVSEGKEEGTGHLLQTSARAEN